MNVADSDGRLLLRTVISDTCRKTSDCGAVAGVTAAFPNDTHAWPPQVYATGHGYAVPGGQSLASLGLVALVVEAVEDLIGGHGLSLLE